MFCIEEFEIRDPIVDVIGSAKERVKAHCPIKCLSKKPEKTCISMPIFLCSWECSIEVNIESGVEVG
ncbi:hypothetical protein ASG65_09530 [Bacillus sp. Leaf13]|nr:hypothetical protein ASG65_09530 [Bacillus sp. Leaf13]